MNVTSFITDQSKISGNLPAIIYSKKKWPWARPSKKSYSFQELEQKINIFANTFKHNGISAQDKVLILSPLSADLIAIAFSLFKIGAVPVFIDPGMNLKSFLQNIKSVEASALIGSSKALILKKIKSKYFSSIKTVINTENGLIGDSLESLTRKQDRNCDEYSYKESDIAGLVLTSGATGPSKAVEYTMKMFIEQKIALEKMLNLSRGEKDLSGFPLFALFSLAIGLPTFISTAIDARVPALTDGKKLAHELIDNNIDFANGSPSIWISLAKYLLANNLKIKNLKKLAMFGAPVSSQLIFDLKSVLPNCDIYTPYGATESLPVSFISDKIIIEETGSLTKQGRGVCVGHLYEKVDIEIVNTENYSKIDKFSPGEIWVSSPMTSLKYFKNEGENLKSKKMIKGNLFHHIGDIGYIDDIGRLWYLGRLAHAIHQMNETIYSIEIEGVLNSHPKIKKSALIKVGSKPCVAVVLTNLFQLEGSKKNDFFDDLVSKNLAHCPKLEKIENFYILKTFPVDTRHNIKIDRIKIGRSIEKI